MRHRRSIVPFLSCLLVLTTAAAASAQPADSSAIAITNVTLIDGTGSAPSPGMTVLIRGSRIADVFATGARPLPAGAVVYDLPGRTVIPGLIESHTHLQDFYESRERLRAELERWLYSGVVGIREMAGDARVSAELDRSVKLGWVDGPDIYFSAVMMGPHFRNTDAVGSAIVQGFNRDPSWIQVLTPETDLPLAVARAAGSGAIALKLYIEMEPALVAAVTREAKRQGLKVWAHPAVFPSRPLEVVNAGVDGISHACGIAWQDADLDPRRFARVTRSDRPMFDPALVSADSPEMRALFDAMRRRGTVFDVTFSMYPRNPRNPFGCSAELMTRLARAAARSGVTLLAGTDWHAPPDSAYPSLHDEMIALVDHDILSPLEAISAATRNATLALGFDDRSGTLQVGKAADLVILEANPAEDIRAIRRVQATMKRGVLYHRADYERRRGRHGE